MNRFQSYLFAAAIAVSGASLFAADATDMNTGPNSAAAQMGTNAVRSGNQLETIGSQQADPATARQVRSSLAQVVNDAVTPNHFDNLTKDLAKSDQARLSNVSNVNTDDLNRAINQFRTDFHNKYGQDFDARSTQFQDALVYSGQDNKSATVALHDVSIGNAMNQSASFSSNAAQSTNHLNDNNVNNSSVNSNMTGAPADRSLNTNDNTQSNRNGVASASGTSTSTLGNRTGPASAGSNSETNVRGNDTLANPGLATNNNANDSSRMNTSSDVSRSAVGTNSNSSLASNNNENLNNNNNGMTGAPADRTLNTNEGTQSNRNGVASASGTSSSTLGDRTGPASAGSNSNTTVRGNATLANPGIAVNNNNNADTNGQTRQDLASSTTTPPAGAALTLNLVNQNGNWCIDLPDQISAQQLKDNLVKHIQTLDDQKSTWPSDVNDAYKATAFHVLRAFNDTAMASER